MKRINHDSDHSRLIAKYGVPKPSGKTNREDVFELKLYDKPHKRPRRKSVPLKRTWLEIHREHLRWKKTPDYAKWRRKQFLKQGGTCFYCDQPLIGARINDEHVLPKSAGGDNSRHNLVLACASCNKEKGSRILAKTELEALRRKNKKKRGTYHLLREQLPTETELGLQLREMLREE